MKLAEHIGAGMSLMSTLHNTHVAWHHGYKLLGHQQSLIDDAGIGVNHVFCTCSEAERS